MKNKGYAIFGGTNKVHYVQVANGKFALLPGKGSPYVFSKFNLLYKDTPLIQYVAQYPDTSV